MDNLGDRIKRYESASSYKLTPRTPVMIRVDGKAFHTLTRKCHKPFDTSFMDSMVLAAIDTAKEIQGFKIGYIQSDEVTFVISDYDNLKSEGWFDYKLAKIVSTSAALMTVNFNYHFNLKGYRPTFDSRAFNLPPNEVTNALLWRAQDYKRNSLQMYARSLYTHKEIHGKNSEDIHNMLHEKGNNWTTDLTGREKNGTFILNTLAGILTFEDIKPTYDSINDLTNRLSL